MRLLILGTGTAALLATIGSFHAHAATITVTDLTDSTADLICDAQCTLREAIASAQDGDTIVWPPTLPFPATTLLVANPDGLTISKNLTIVGPGANKLELNAQDLSRVLTIIAPATSVTISGMTLSHGRVYGATGATECLEDPEIGTVCGNGLPGESTAGGCIHTTIAQLTLSGMEIHDCALISGRGGHGGYLAHSVFSVGRGFDGGPGGNAVGGAIYATGALTMSDSAVHGVSATSGGGGNGGPSDYSDLFPDSPPGPPGSGASGGSVYGAVLYSVGGATLRNVTLIADAASSGFGGYGGTLYNLSLDPIGVANGGNGGWISGGVWLWQGASQASFSTFHAGDYDLGVRGFSGAPQDGVFVGRYLYAVDTTSPLIIEKSILASTVPTDPIAPASYCAGGAITTPASIADNACSGAIVTAASLGSKITGAQGITTLPPQFTTSVAINAAANCLDADSQAVSHDANGTPRPQFGFCDLGAHEVTDAVFVNSFE